MHLRLEEDEECLSEFEGNDGMGDKESERSYAGSIAEYYYELKEEREERKKEILREK